MKVRSSEPRADGRQPGGQFTALAHQSAREADVAGREHLAQQDGGEGAEDLLAELQAMCDPDRTEFYAFERWRQANGDRELHLDAVHDWKNSTEYEEFDLQRRTDSWVAAGMPDPPRTYSLPYAELKRRVDEGLLTQPGEDQAAYDERVRADRLARGVELGDYLTNPRAFAHGEADDHYDESMDVLCNYGSRSSDWRPLGGECYPTDPDPRGIHPYCGSCHQERPGDRGDTCVRVTAEGASRLELVDYCWRCRDELDQL